MISSSEISVIVQGPIYGDANCLDNEKVTKKCCDRVRELLPDAEIILSTWEGSDVTGIDFDKVIFNQDPGGILMLLDGVERLNNTNRMIVSTLNGLKAAQRIYAVKIRTDAYLENTDFLLKFRKFPLRDHKGLVKERIISLSANHPKRGAAILFSVSDWFEFGYTEDLIKLWDAPLQKKEDLVTHGGLPDWKDNLVAESYIWLLFVKKDPFYEERLKGYEGVIPVNQENLELYEKSLAEYAVLYEGKQLGLNSLKYWNKNYVRRDFARASCYMHYEWEKLYTKYCDHQYRPTMDFKGWADVITYRIVFQFLQKKMNKLYVVLRGQYRR